MQILWSETGFATWGICTRLVSATRICHRIATGAARPGCRRNGWAARWRTQQFAWFCSIVPSSHGALSYLHPQRQRCFRSVWRSSFFQRSTGLDNREAWLRPRNRRGHCRSAVRPQTGVWIRTRWGQRRVLWGCESGSQASHWFEKPEYGCCSLLLQHLVELWHEVCNYLFVWVELEQLRSEVLHRDQDHGMKLKFNLEMLCTVGEQQRVNPIGLDQFMEDEEQKVNNLSAKMSNQDPVNMECNTSHSNRWDYASLLTKAWSLLPVAREDIEADSEATLQVLIPVILAIGSGRFSAREANAWSKLPTESHAWFQNQQYAPIHSSSLTPILLGLQWSGRIQPRDVMTTQVAVNCNHMSITGSQLTQREPPNHHIPCNLNLAIAVPATRNRIQIRILLPRTSSSYLIDDSGSTPSSRLRYDNACNLHKLLQFLECSQRRQSSPA